MTMRSYSTPFRLRARLAGLCLGLTLLGHVQPCRGGEQVGVFLVKAQGALLFSREGLQEPARPHMKWFQQHKLPPGAVLKLRKLRDSTKYYRIVAAPPNLGEWTAEIRRTSKPTLFYVLSTAVEQAGGAIVHGSALRLDVSKGSVPARFTVLGEGQEKPRRISAATVFALGFQRRRSGGWEHLVALAQPTSEPAVAGYWVHGRYLRAGGQPAPTPAPARAAQPPASQPADRAIREALVLRGKLGGQGECVAGDAALVRAIELRAADRYQEAAAAAKVAVTVYRESQQGAKPVAAPAPRPPAKPKPVAPAKPKPKPKPKPSEAEKPPAPSGLRRQAEEAVAAATALETRVRPDVLAAVSAHLAKARAYLRGGEYEAAVEWARRAAVVFEAHLKSQALAKLQVLMQEATALQTHLTRGAAADADRLLDEAGQLMAKGQLQAAAGRAAEARKAYLAFDARRRARQAIADGQAMGDQIGAGSCIAGDADLDRARQRLAAGDCAGAREAAARARAAYQAWVAAQEPLARRAMERAAALLRAVGPGAVANADRSLEEARRRSAKGEYVLAIRAADAAAKGYGAALAARKQQAQAAIADAKRLQTLAGKSTPREAERSLAEAERCFAQGRYGAALASAKEAEVAVAAVVKTFDEQARRAVHEAADAQQQLGVGRVAAGDQELARSRQHLKAQAYLEAIKAAGVAGEHYQTHIKAADAERSKLDRATEDIKAWLGMATEYHWQPVAEGDRRSPAPLQGPARYDVGLVRKEREALAGQIDRVARHCQTQVEEGRRQLRAASGLTERWQMLRRLGRDLEVPLPAASVTTRECRRTQNPPEAEAQALFARYRKDGTVEPAFDLQYVGDLRARLKREVAGCGEAFLAWLRAQERHVKALVDQAAARVAGAKPADGAGEERKAWLRQAQRSLRLASERAAELRAVPDPIAWSPATIEAIERDWTQAREAVALALDPTGPGVTFSREGAEVVRVAPGDRLVVSGRPSLGGESSRQCWVIRPVSPRAAPIRITLRSTPGGAKSGRGVAWYRRAEDPRWIKLDAQGISSKGEVRLVFERGAEQGFEIMAAR